ncbi:2-ketoisovalerate ferredoxin oxidoreductase subunit alpha [Dethiobacter alkaliphilus]|uniref:Pyruvate flavodoxin/ferredoxin oxidoreductase domain protein n=1 Tax=Dethiobacter alkaliphilus AHT 1 TaxID=555088 RepID=C0GFI6_DETAL|nr:2-ketoisovalerate ferredoxin oxidoreductase subunit alpha [Dethiobacter alkaliphilus]EEG77946.1 pyruvate flavodoxin/ferredoxin oxidoreductase domain protein [Dethiobacter alkaliphilus AHT 1]
MAKTVAMVGTDAVAEAMRQINPDVVPAYPITPQTAVVEKYAQMVADGIVDSEMINAESEHSAMSAAIGAAAGGARVMTATSSQGLALMWEMLYIASGMRLPVVMANVNRSLSAPINIHCDHSDSMGARDSGWIQLFSENAQETYDNVLQAIRIAEHPDVLTPVMVLLDGFIISHSIDRFDLIDDDVAKAFVGQYTPRNSLLDAANPSCWGAFDGLGGYFFEFKRAQAEGMLKAPAVIREVGKEYAEISGRRYDYFASYRMEDAEFVIVAAGSAAGTIRTAVDIFREKGLRVGLLKLRMFRPFPQQELVEALSHAKAVAVFDRSDTFAGDLGGPIFVETRSAFYEAEKRPQLMNFIYGLGGRDLPMSLVNQAIEMFKDAGSAEQKKRIVYLGLRD